uniref:FPL domain-containing protein n=1 Tax=Glycine max TaxID=3847 RepID=A0A0R0L4J4_SOYBN
MEMQVVVKFVRVLKLGRTNLRSKHAIYYMFSNEHMNYLITYTFDFFNEEILSYYISFLRAISGKFNKNRISLRMKTRNEEVVSFPLYVKARRFAFHKENMILTIVCVVTLTIYHFGDECVNMYITSVPHTDYFSNLVSFFKNQCMDLNRLISETLKNLMLSLLEFLIEKLLQIIVVLDEIKDNLYYFSDVISVGIPDVGRVITDNNLMLLIFPILLHSLRVVDANVWNFSLCLSIVFLLMFSLLCCNLRIVKIKDLTNSIVVALFYPLDTFTIFSRGKVNCYISDRGLTFISQEPEDDNIAKCNAGCLTLNVPNSSSSSGLDPKSVMSKDNCSSSNLAIRLLLTIMINFLPSWDDAQVWGSLSVLATLLQTKELDESMPDRLGILPQCKQHKKQLLDFILTSIFTITVEFTFKSHY